MLKSMTGFGRCFIENEDAVQTWEVRSVNGRHLDIKWRLPLFARGFESRLEKVVRRYAARGRLDITLLFQPRGAGMLDVRFNEVQAEAMFDRLAAFAHTRGDVFEPDYNRLMGLGFLWEDGGMEDDESLPAALEAGLATALEDWNQSRSREAKDLERDLSSRFLRMEEWVSLFEERAPDIKEERFAVLRERINEVLAGCELELAEARFLQEVTLLADKLDVSEELTRLRSHLGRMRELTRQGTDAGRRLDFTLQEAFREITTCGNKIQDAQLSRLVVDFKNELEKCREQVQNIE